MSSWSRLTVERGNRNALRFRSFCLPLSGRVTPRIRAPSRRAVGGFVGLIPRAGWRVDVVLRRAATATRCGFSNLIPFPSRGPAGVASAATNQRVRALEPLIRLCR